MNNTGTTEKRSKNVLAKKHGNVDVVNNPTHYNQSGVECIEATRAATDDGFEYYLQGNIIKYL